MSSLCLSLSLSLSSLLFSSLLFSSLLSSLSFFYCLLCCAQNFDPSCAGRLHCSPEMCGATRKKASSNRDAGKSEEYTRTRAVRERNPPSGKQDDEKKARGIQRKEGRVPCFVWASQRGWSSFIERMDSGNIVRVFVCACVCVCDACACERVQKY